MNSNLIVIGNGFDLECGLKSTYGDFFKKRISDDLRQCFYRIHRIFIDNKNESFASINFSNKQLKQVKVMNFRGLMFPEDFKSMRKADLTFWDFAFLSIGMSPDANWHDVEENIRFFLSNEVKSKTNYSEIGLKNKVLGYGEESKIRLCCILAYAFFDEDRYKNSKDIYDFLYKELRLFEEKFTEYLWTEYNRSESVYNEKFPILIQTILNSNSDNNSNGDYSILSFNYTRHENVADRITNIHGTLQDKNIIFGIDQKTVLSARPEYRFTKTFRKMTQVNKSNSPVTITGKDKLNNIFFYGHSLSELDYSYFQSIFDYYDIYSSGIKLIFCCTHFDESKSEEEILQIQTLRASKMIETYGFSMGKEREQHGKNLLHKLMLEGRVDVTIINPNYKGKQHNSR